MKQPEESARNSYGRSQCRLPEMTKTNIDANEFAFQIWDNLLDGCALIGSDWKFLYVNESAAVQWNRKRGDLIGRTILAIHPGVKRTAVYTGLKRCMDERSAQRFEYRLNSPEGDSLWYEFSVAPAPCGIFVQTHDISERKKAEEALSARARLVLFSNTHSLDELLEESLNEVEKLTNSMIGFYHFVDPDQTSLTLQNWSTRTKNYFCKAEGKGAHYAIARAGVWADCVHLHKPVIHNDYASLQNKKGLPPGHAPLIRELVVPVQRKDKITAILGIGNKQSDYTEADVRIVSLFADLVWDIAERKRAENHLVSIMKAVESSSEAIGISDARGRHFYQNKALSDLFGYATAEELDAAGGGPAVVKNPEIAKEMFDAIMNGKSWAGELDMVTKSGRVFPAFERADAIKDSDGNLIGLIGIITDITERKKSETSLRWLMDEQKIILDNIGVGVLFSIYRRVVWTNRRLAGMFGYSPEELVGKDTAVFHPDKISYDQMCREVYPSIEKGEPFIGEFQLKRRDGSFLICQLVAQAVTPNIPEDGAIWVLEDVTERRQAEDALRRSEEKYRIVADFTYDWEFWIKPDESIVYSSPSCERITGYSSRAFIEDPSLLRSIIHPDDVALFDEHRHTVRTGNLDREIEFRIIRTDGGTRWIAHACQPVYDDQGIFAGTRVNNRDITRRRAFELEQKQLIHDLQRVLEKMSSLIGLSPLCSSCKKIRDDEAYWQRVKMYAPGHAEPVFSDGLCPDCAKKNANEK